jgi:hypothetical protein
MALRPEIRFNDYTKLGTILRGLQENNGEVLMCTRLNGYAQTSRTMTAQGRAAQKITRMEEHNRRIPYTATGRARRHIFTAEEWEQIDEEYWIDKETRLGTERILRIDEQIKNTANGNLGRGRSCIGSFYPIQLQGSWIGVSDSMAPMRFFTW